MKVPKKTAKDVQLAITNALAPVQNFVFTLTADNGKEFVNYSRIAQKLEAVTMNGTSRFNSFFIDYQSMDE